MRIISTALKSILLLACLVERAFAFSAVAPRVAPTTKSTTTSDDSGLAEVKRDMLEIHASEIAGGKEAFAELPDNGNNKNLTTAVWSDDDFTSRDLGESNAGSDGKSLPKNGSVVFESKSPVLTEDECRLIVDEARAIIQQGRIQEESGSDVTEEERQRSNYISNSQLGEARLSNMPKTRAWLRETLYTRFYPLLKDRFGVDDLVLYDGLVMGNLAPTRSQPIHRDASLVTLNVALSGCEEYDGGGTYVEALDEILTIDRGHLLCHAGSAMHAGNAITRGERWVFVLFVLGESRPQLARRCHAKAIEHLREGELDASEDALVIGMESTTTTTSQQRDNNNDDDDDHLLHTSMGRVHMMRSGKSDNEDDHHKHLDAAIESFEKAEEAYPVSGDALVTAAQLLMDRRKFDEALRKFDVLLERVGDRDFQPLAQMSLRSLAYGARRDAARCALICADKLYQKERKPEPAPPSLEMVDSSFSSSPFALWAQQHLPIAIDRLHTCLRAAPNEPTLMGMMDHAQFLYSKAQAEKPSNDNYNCSK